MDDLRDTYGSSIPKLDEYGNPIRRQTEGGEIRRTDDFDSQIQDPARQTGYIETVPAVQGVTTRQTGYLETVPGHGGLNPTGHTKESSAMPAQGEAVSTCHITAAHGPVPGTVIGGGMNATGHSTGGYQEKKKEHRGLRHSGSSSSSEDDGQGGRRKKSLKEKIKEKLPGTHKKDHDHDHDHYQHLAGDQGLIDEQHHDHDHEKKGVMEKIKEKLPGHH